MEDSDPLDSINSFSKEKGNQTIIMFIVSLIMAIITVLTIVIDEYSPSLNWTDMLSTLFGISAFVTSIVGLAVGFSEIKYSSSRNLVITGIVGHFAIVLAPIIYIIYIISYVLILW